MRQERTLRRKGFSLIAGVDEAGRGPIAGPVVASAVILKKDSFFNRIDDSKKLTDRSRRKAYDEILANSFIGVGVVDENVIDSINILQATKWAMRMALANLPIAPQYVLVDGNMKLDILCRHKYIIRGDSKSLSIAAASIIAKVTRDNLMNELDKNFPQYGFKRHKGYGTAEHIAAVTLHGPCPIHRKTFAPINCRLICQKEE